MKPISIDRESDTPIYRQIASQLREAIARGDLRDSERLPTTRSLALRLGINRLTVSRAYEELTEEGAISAHVGRGSFVHAGAPVSVQPAPRPAAAPARVAWGALFSRTTERVADEGLPAASMGAVAPGVISFASLFPDPTLFPVEPFRRSLDSVMRREGHRVLGYGPPAGMPALRKMIAGHLRASGMEVKESEVVITSGSQQGIDLVARALLDPGDVVLVENPTYTGAVQVFQSYGAELVGVPVDDEGAIVSLLEEAVARHRPKLIYLMPNFQNPTSETMSLRRRHALIELAVSRRVAVLEDDFGGDLRFDGPSLPALKALDRGDNVVYLSTFAKKLLPGLRIGWLAAPAVMAERLTRLKKITDYSTSLLLQAALHHFILHGDLDRHLANVIDCYRQRRDAMLSAMKRCFPPEVTWSRPRGGLVVWVTLPAGVDADEVAAAAAERSVLVGRGDLFYVDGGTRQNLRLTFAQAGTREIHGGIRVLGEIIEQRIRARRPERRSAPAESLPLI
ncbi:MAG TPA: PLP-dependent aminotransferase family protein [Candidatus Polarisedimenticolia bacterium]|jgi:DNA-binding transcriptional MocR family regulator